MLSFSSLRKATSLLRYNGAFNRPLSADFAGYLKNEKRHFCSSWNIARGESGRSLPRVLGNLGMNLCAVSVEQNVSAPYALGFRNFIHSTGQGDDETGRSSRPMDFVRGIVEEDEKRFTGPSQFGQFPRYNVEHSSEFVHIKLMRNNTFVTVTDSKGNKRIGASSGCLPELKGGPKMSRYAAEATAEHVGRLARNMGLKSVVVRVKGFTYFKKKRQAIMSFREGFANSRDQNPIVYIEDTTRRPHNGCRLPKKRRI